MQMVNLKHHQSGQWNLEDFVQLANDLLRQLDIESRDRDPLNPRLVRYYTSQSLLDPPEKQGREARYLYRHLLQVLLVRMLLSSGFQSLAIQPLVNRDSDLLLSDLERYQQAHQAPAPSRKANNPATDFLLKLQSPAPREERKKALSESMAEQVWEAQMAPPPVPSIAPLMSALSQEPLPEQYQRHVLQDGLELHLSDRYEVPEDPQSREALLKRIQQILKIEP